MYNALQDSKIAGAVAKFDIIDFTLCRGAIGEVWSKLNNHRALTGQNRYGRVSYI